MRSTGKLRHNVQGRQKQRISVVIVFATCGAALVLLLMALFNFSTVHKVKARDFEIRQVEDQIFLNEMSIPAPVINSTRPDGPNTINIQQVKPVNNSAAN